jgi:hypothetical protein
VKNNRQNVYLDLPTLRAVSALVGASFLRRRNKVLTLGRIVVEIKEGGRLESTLNGREGHGLESGGGVESSWGGGDGEEEIRYRHIGGYLQLYDTLGEV